MKTKSLMIASAVYLGLSGLGLTFIPGEIAKHFSFETNTISILILQVLGSLYLGFSMLNWMTKNNLIGGIYSRPLVIGNLVHFLVSAFALIKIVGKYSESNSLIIVALTIIYCVFTLCFGYVFKTIPGEISKLNYNQ